MVAITLKIPVPNIASLIPTYDVIRVFRSDVSIDGPFVERTAATAEPAVIVGSIAGPFLQLNGKTLIIRTSNVDGDQPDVAVTFSDPNPITITQVVTAVNATTVDAVASDDSGKLKLTTNSIGKNAKITIVGGTALGDLGFAIYQTDVGEDPFIPLVATDNLYEFVDPSGTNSAWYRWQFYNTVSLASSSVTTAIHPQEAIIDPNRKLQDFRAIRGLVLIRKRTHTFPISFWEDEAAGIPITPADATKYPSYAIYDINGECIVTGVATMDGAPPNYKVEFTAPADALLSNDDRRWRIEYVIASDTGRQLTRTQEFDVRDEDITESESRDQKLLAVECQEFTIRIRLPKRPYSLKLRATESNNKDVVIINDAKFPPPAALLLNEVIDGDTVVYSYTIASDVLMSAPFGKQYTAMWTIHQTPVSNAEYNFTIIVVPPFKLLPAISSLRMFIDKFQKKRGRVQAYEESDIVEYLEKGLHWLNSIHPAQLVYSFTTVPPSLSHFWMIGSALYGLQAQHLCEVDLKFNQSGQTVSLDYDRSGDLADAMGRLENWLQQAKPAKMHLYRSSTASGIYAGRSYRLVGLNQVVTKLSSTQGGSSGLIELMSTIGLL